jgi:hypothetical protein
MMKQSYMSNNAGERVWEREKDGVVVIVGAGPAGLASAISFIELGCFSKVEAVFAVHII